ncbi:MAG TPA: efflux RND transporter periplasmic adaptor subunit [Prosthecobacter sp.]|nr:efflux RND transporter periplasmic adaptor subunit [Prosthecobacter sp.]
MRRQKVVDWFGKAGIAWDGGIAPCDCMTSEKPTLDALRIDRSAAPKSGGTPWVVWLLVVAALAVGGWYFWQKRPVVAEVETVVVRVSTTSSGGSAVGGTAKVLLNGSGYVVARRSSTVSSKVTGKVVEIFVEEGMKVEQGQEVAKLDASNIEAGLKLAEARLESARGQLAETKPNVLFSQQELERFRDLVNSKATSASDLNRAQAEANVMKARLERLEADLVVAEREVAQWRQQLDDMTIRAPFAGVVTSKDSQPGEMISPMSAGGGFTRTGICTIVDMGSLEIEVDVNESFINRVKPGQPVEATLDAYSDWKIPAKVIAIIPTADRQKATVRVRVGFEKLDPRILPEMAVKVAFQEAAEVKPAEKAEGDVNAKPAQPMMAVPKAALHDDEGKSIVWVVNDDRVERRAVTVGNTAGDEALIAAGLNRGEKIVTRSNQPLTDGAKIKELKP